MVHVMIDLAESYDNCLHLIHQYEGSHQERDLSHFFDQIYVHQIDCRQDF